jgi:hypothetical protein
MKKRTLKNEVYRLPKTDIKPIRVDTSKMEELKPVEEIKYIKGKFRDPMPPLQLAWLKIKRGISGYVDSVATGIDAKFNLVLSEFAKKLATNLTLFFIILLGIVAIILTVKYIL